MPQAQAVASLCVKNLGLPKNKEIQKSPKQQNQSKSKLPISLIEKGFFLHCIYQGDHSAVDNTSGAELFIFLVVCRHHYQRLKCSDSEEGVQPCFSVALPGRAKFLE